ncbi:AAA family ATPase [Salinisphaera sp. RV14]|uniref:AAA family ATPase n=1 Tax=unclassified Salinisphaera TaxID=2649847 RepID=UPI003F85F901
MEDFTFQKRDGESFALQRLNLINIILGRNGAGKSRFLRLLDETMGNEETYRVRYVTPERGGVFRREGNIDTNMTSDQNWANNTRRSNQASSFKSMSHVYLRNTESAYLRKLQNTDARGRSFQVDCLEPINRMLSNVSIEQADPDFVFRSAHGDLVEADKLSSGESETIALASEVLNFMQNLDTNKINVLLLDEPDVHQHPDLQARFGFYLVDQLESLNQDEQSKIAICLATHSTPLVCSLASSAYTSVGTKEFDSDTVRLSPVSDHIKKVAPFFGHPLSLSLSRDPMLILEGEDDERVWQQAARSSQGRIRVFPVLAHSVSQQSELESFSGPILGALYDEPVAYSLRDGDGISDQLAPVGPVVRFRLRCYAIENALVTTECLANLGIDWRQLQQLSESWLAENAGHKDACALRKLVDSEDRLRNEKIKDIRQLIVSVTGSKKPWEVVVGQALAATVGGESSPDDPFALLAFVGSDAAERLLHAERAVGNGA